MTVIFSLIAGFFVGISLGYEVGFDDGYHWYKLKRKKRERL